MKKARKTKRLSHGECFAIMPFGGWFDRYWEDIYRPAIEAAALTPTRADDLFRSGDIMQDVWRSTQRCTVILADLTTRNSNVFYELGLAHALGKPAILISESLDDVPFDLRGLRVLLYDRSDPNWGISLRRGIATALRETLADPVAAVPSAFINAKERAPKQTLSQSDKELVQLKQDVELLKRQLLDPGAVVYAGSGIGKSSWLVGSTPDEWSRYKAAIGNVSEAYSIISGTVGNPSPASKASKKNE